MAVELPVLTFTCCDVDCACYVTTAKVHGNIISVVPTRCTSDGKLFLETIKVFFTRSPTCFPGRAARWAAWFVPISIHSWESPPGFSQSQHPFFLHWCLVSPAVAAWCPLFLPSYPLFYCPGQISLLRQMWWVVLVWRRAMELLRHGRCRVKAACRTRYFFFPPLLTDGRFAITRLCLHIWRRDGACQTPRKGYKMLLSLPSTLIWQEIRFHGIIVIIRYRTMCILRHADRAQFVILLSCHLPSSLFSLLNYTGR